MTESARDWTDLEWVGHWVARDAQRHTIDDARELAAPLVVPGTQPDLADHLEVLASAGLAEADTPWRLLSTVLLLARRPVARVGPA